MSPYNPSDAIHCNAASIYEIDKASEKIEVFDDEFPGQLSLYLSDGIKRWPARTVALEPAAHCLRILSAWSRGYPLIDSRKNKSTPLPS